MPVTLPTPAEIDQVLAGAAFTHPVTLADMAELRAALGGGPEVFHRIREVVVQLHKDGRMYYERILPVTGAPITPGPRPSR